MIVLTFSKKGVEVFLSANLFLVRNYYFFFWEIKPSFCLFKVLERNATIFLKILPWASKAIEVAAAFKLSKSASLFFVVMILASQKNGKYFWGVSEAFFYSVWDVFPQKNFPSKILWSRLIQIWFWTAFKD